MSDTPTVTMSMFWPLLMQAAGNEYNVNAQTALANIKDKTGLPVDRIYREDVAEEIAREHFPSGTTTKAVGFYSMFEGWSDECDEYGTFEEMLDGQHDSGPLSPTDPAHVAMVVRILAISQSLPVYVEGPSVKFKHNDECPSAGVDHDHDGCGPGVTIRLERTRPARSSAEPVSVGYFFSYRPGESAENFNVADALFRWMVERHAEIVKATEAAAESSKDSEPAPANVIEFKAT